MTFNKFKQNATNIVAAKKANFKEFVLLR